LRNGYASLSADKKKIVLRISLQKKWNDLYSTWNMAFVSQFKTWPFFLVKLLVPSVFDYTDHPGEYIYRRALALYTHIHYVFLGKKHYEKTGEENINWRLKEIPDLWGRVNRSSSKDYQDRVNKIKAFWGEPGDED